MCNLNVISIVSRLDGLRGGRGPEVRANSASFCMTIRLELLVYKARQCVFFQAHQGGAPEKAR